MFLNLLLILAVAFGSFQLVILLILWKKLAKPKFYLVPLMLGILWILIEFLAVRNVMAINFPLFYGTQHGAWLLLGPSFWFYWQALNGNSPNYQSFLKQLIPFFLLVFCLPLVLPDLISARANHYGMLTVLAYYKLGFTFWQGVYAVIFIAQFFHLSFYLWKAIQSINHTSKLKQKIVQPWIKWSLNGMIAVILGALIFFGVMLWTYKYIRVMDYFYALPFALFTFFLTFKFTLFPSLLRSDLKQIIPGKKYQKSNLDKALLKAYAKRLEAAMQQRKLYKNPDITLAKLASEIGINSHHLSLVLNSQFNQKFYEYVNEYRIKAAKKLLDSTQQPSIQIALEVGFNNKATFHKYFKKYTAVTPSQFRKMVRKNGQAHKY